MLSTPSVSLLVMPVLLLLTPGCLRRSSVESPRATPLPRMEQPLGGALLVERQP
ncbi:hypothetical protein [Cystobacter fuscus]|nr:hypothetical protein [Cystobacter fuscus]